MSVPALPVNADIRAITDRVNVLIRQRNAEPGTVVTRFRETKSSVLDTLNAATLYAIENNAWPLILPAGEYDLGGDTWYINDGQSISGGPLDGINIVGSGVGNNTKFTPTSGVLIKNGVVWIGVGSSYTDEDGNRPDVTNTFVSRNMRLSNVRIEGGLEVWGCQVGGLIDQVLLKPTNVQSRTRGLYCVFSHTIRLFGVRVQEGGTSIDGAVFDSCSDFQLINCAFNYNKIGLQVAREITYSPRNPNGHIGSVRSTMAISTFRIEGNHEEQAILANLSAGLAFVKCDSPKENLATIPLIRIGHQTDDDQSTGAFCLGGFIGGRHTSDSDEEDGSELDETIVAGSIGVQLDKCNMITFMPGTRIRAVETGIYITDDCTVPQAIISLRNDALIPVATETTTRNVTSKTWGGVDGYAMNGQTGANRELWRILADDSSADFYSRMFSGTASQNSRLFFDRAGGTTDAVAVPPNNADVGEVSFRVCTEVDVDGDPSWEPVGRVRFKSKANPPTSTNSRGYILLEVTQDGAISPSSWLEGSREDGILALGQATAFLSADHRVLWTKPCLVSELPASPSNGMRAYVTDSTTATFGAAVTGGGSNNVPVYYYSGGGGWKVG